jgi:phosphotriesterase-related protein
MAMVNTARGEIDASALGRTLMHEHIFVFLSETHRNDSETWKDEDNRIHDAVRQLRRLKSSGIDSIVDMTVLGLGRNVSRIQRIAARIDLNILVATGIYICDDPAVFAWSINSADGSNTTDILTKMFVHDIREGIDGTGIRAAILKCATDARGITPAAEHCLRAVARAHRITGTPVSTHTDAGTQGGLAQQRIFEEEGVDLSHVVIGHCGDTTDPEYLEKLMRKGSFIGMDRFGIEPVLSFEKRVDTVARLCEQGYAEKMVMSHDAACYMEGMPEDTLKKKTPNWHFLHICNDVLPALKERGVTDAQIRAMLVENPRRILS